MNECVGLVQELYKFIRKHRSLEIFKLQSYYIYKIEMDRERKVQLARACSMLTKIDLVDVEFSADEAYDFITQCTRLQLFKFKFNEEIGGSDSAID